MTSNAALVCDCTDFRMGVGASVSKKVLMRLESSAQIGRMLASLPLMRGGWSSVPVGICSAIVLLSIVYVHVYYSKD
jgi:hypothetical protein